MEYRKSTFSSVDQLLTDMKPYQLANDMKPYRPMSQASTESKPTRSITKWVPKPLSARERELLDNYYAKARFQAQCEKHWLELIQLGL